MILSEKETAAIKDLQTQEETCIEKYGKYCAHAKDPVLVNLFTELKRTSSSTTIPWVRS